MFYVYFHYRVDTGECFYIGKGKNKRAFVSKRRNLFWCNIINKTDYKVVIAQYFEDEKDAFLFEIDMISRINPVANLTSGGEGVSNVKVSESTRMKHKEHSLRMWSNPDFRQKRTRELVDATKTPEAREKSSEIQKKFFNDKNNRIARAISCGGKPYIVYKNSEFYSEEISIIEFAREHGVPAPNICRCLKGKGKSAHGFTFKYKELL